MWGHIQQKYNPKSRLLNKYWANVFKHQWPSILWVFGSAEREGQHFITKIRHSCIFVKFLVSEKWKVWMWTKSGIEYLYCIVETMPAGEGTNRIQTMKLFRFPSIRLMLCEHMVSSVPKMRKQSIYEIKIWWKTANRRNAMYHMTIKSNEFNYSVLNPPSSPTLQKSNHKKENHCKAICTCYIHGKMPLFDILSYKKWIKLFAGPLLQRSNVRWECQLSEQPGQWHTPYFFQIFFVTILNCQFFLFCNLSAFLLNYKHSQSNVLTEFKGLFLVRHRSSCRPIGRVEIRTANQSWEALLVNWFHPFMSKHWSVETFRSCK